MTKNTLNISRAFNAPKEMVFDAFATSEALAQWWGPKGMPITVLKLEFRPKGIFHYRMNGANGNSMHAMFIYQVIDRPDTLEFITSFTDEKGNVIRAPFFDNWPLEIYSKITFIENGGRTTLNLTAWPINSRPDEIERFMSITESMNQGYGGTFDQLETYLKTNT